MTVPVELRDVSRSYAMGPEQEIRALHRITISVRPGSAVAITGPSGSGKSTLLHVIGAMDVSDEGSVRVGDVDVTNLKGAEQADYRRSIGFVFQKFHLLPALTIVDNVVAPLLPFRTSFDKWSRASELLAAVGLEDRADSLPARLSGGQQQRVAIARALINDPALLLADEPTGNLDSETGTEIMDLLLRLRTERGMTFLIATHDPVVASRCERIVRLKDGEVVDDVDIESGVHYDEVLGRIAGLGPGA